jgi:hypothetical protein
MPTPCATGERTVSNSDQSPDERPFAEPVSVLLAEPDEPVPWIVEGLFAEGAHGWIGAEPKVGKSWLGLDLAVCVALGRPFLGYDVTRPYRVLYVQEEDSRRRVRRRLRQLLRGHGCDDSAARAALDQNLQVAIRKGFRIDQAVTRKWLQRAMASFHPDLVIVDVFNEVHGAKEKDQDGISPVLGYFTDLERKCGGAFIILHHFYKGDARTPRGRGGQSLRGSSALHGWAENSLYLFDLDKNRFRIEPESKDESDSQHFEVEITDTDNDGVQLVRREVDDAYTDLGRWTALERRLAATPGGEFTAKEAGASMGCDKSTARARLSRWEKQGRLVSRRDGHGGRNGTVYFRLPPASDPADGLNQGDALAVPTAPLLTSGGASPHVENHYPQQVGAVGAPPIGGPTLPSPHPTTTREPAADGPQASQTVRTEAPDAISGLVSTGVVPCPQGTATVPEGPR